MKMWSVLCLAVCLMFSVLACSSPGADTSAPKDEATAPVAPAPETAPAATPAPEAAPVTVPASAPEAALATAPAATAGPTGLEGSTWKLGEFTVAFKDAATLNVKGGPLPGGIDATYKVEAGNVTINVMGQTKTGTWDGTALVIDGTTAEKQ